MQPQDIERGLGGAVLDDGTVADELEPLDARALVAGKAAIDEADGLGVAPAGGAGDARGREADVGLRSAADALGHCRRHVLAHRAHRRDGLLGHAEQLDLGLVAVGHQILEEEARDAGHLGQVVADEAASARFGHRDGLAAMLQQRRDDAVERVVARPEDGVAEQPLALLADRGDQLGRLDLRRGSGRELHADDALTHQQPEQRVRVAAHQVAEGLVDARLGQAPQAEALDADGCALDGHRLDEGPQVVGEHRLHLAGHAGQDGHARVVAADDEAGRRALRVGQDGRALGHHGLDAVAGRHLAAVAVEAPLHVLERRVVEHEADARGTGHAVAGQIVLGRAEPAADDDQVAVRRVGADGPLDLVLDIAHRLVAGHLDAQLAELLGQPRRIAVHDLARDHLVADRQDHRFHQTTSGDDWPQRHRGHGAERKRREELPTFNVQRSTSN